MERRLDKLTSGYLDSLAAKRTYREAYFCKKYGLTRADGRKLFAMFGPRRDRLDEAAAKHNLTKR